MTLHVRSCATVLAVAAVCLVAPVASAQVASVTPLALGGLPPGVHSHPRGINQASQVVGRYTAPADGGCSVPRDRAFLWTPADSSDLDPDADGTANGAMVVLPGGACGSGDQANDISDNGLYAVGLSDAAILNPAGAAFWRLDQNPIDTLPLACGTYGLYSEARAVNDSAMVVGIAQDPVFPGSQRRRAWRVVSATSAPDCDAEGAYFAFLPMLLGAEANEYAWSDAHDVNSQGFIAGWSDAAVGGRHAVLWDPGGNLIDLGIPFSGQHAEAWGINEGNQVVGRFVGSDNFLHAFIWTPTDPADPDSDDDGLGDGAFQMLSPTAPAEAFGINDFAQVVGGSPPEGMHGVTWDPSGAMTPLPALPGSVSPGGGGVFRINNASRAIGQSELPSPSFGPTATLWEIVLDIDAGVAGGGFRTAGRVVLNKCAGACVEKVTIKLKNYGKLPVPIEYSVTAAPPGAGFSAACGGTTAPVEPNKVVEITGCEVSYSSSGEVTLELATAPAFGGDLGPGNDIATARVKVLP